MIERDDLGDLESGLTFRLPYWFVVLLWLCMIVGAYHIIASTWTVLRWLFTLG